LLENLCRGGGRYARGFRVGGFRAHDHHD
jgi:hypothetical protein